MPPRNAAIIALTGLICLGMYVRAMEIRPAEPIADALLLIDKRYIRDVPQRDLVDAAMRGIVSELDPYSNFLPPTRATALQEELHQSFPGIGIMIEQPPGTDRVRVISPIVGSPAQRAGIMAGDILWTVGGKDTAKLKLDEIRNVLRGPEGTIVDIQLKRLGQDELIDVQVKRAEIPVDSVVGFYRGADDAWVYRLQEHPRIAYIRITMFGERTSDEVATILKSLDNDFSSLILDVRSNPGGLLNAAVDICDLFLDAGVIVQTRERDNRLVEVISADPGKMVAEDKPLVVLVNGDSASASEVMAACLQGNGRAAIAGSRSFGKGTVQEVLALESGRSLLKLTTAGFFGPDGQKIHREEDSTEKDEWGVIPIPELLVPMDIEQQRGLHHSWTMATFPHAVMFEPPTDEESEKSQPNSETKPDSEPDAEVPVKAPATKASSFQDTQLERAIEYLLEKTKTSGKVAA